MKVISMLLFVILLIKVHHDMIIATYFFLSVLLVMPKQHPQISIDCFH